MKSLFFVVTISILSFLVEGSFLSDRILQATTTVPTNCYDCNSLITGYKWANTSKTCVTNATK